MAHPNPELSPASRIQPRPGILGREIGGEMVLLDVEAGVYYGLNEVGMRAWALFSEGSSLGAAHERLLSEYETEPAVLWQDLESLVRDLAANGLIDVAAP